MNGESSHSLLANAFNPYSSLNDAVIWYGRKDNQKFDGTILEIDNGTIKAVSLGPEKVRTGDLYVREQERFKNVDTIAADLFFHGDDGHEGKAAGFVRQIGGDAKKLENIRTFGYFSTKDAENFGWENALAVAIPSLNEIYLFENLYKQGNKIVKELRKAGADDIGFRDFLEYVFTHEGVLHLAKGIKGDAKSESRLEKLAADIYENRARNARTESESKVYAALMVYALMRSQNAFELYGNRSNGRKYSQLLSTYASLGIEKGLKGEELKAYMLEKIKKYDSNAITEEKIKRILDKEKGKKGKSAEKNKESEEDENGEDVENAANGEEEKENGEDKENPDAEENSDENGEGGESSGE